MSFLNYSDNFIDLLKSQDRGAWKTLSTDATPQLFKVIQYTLNQSSHESSEATCFDILQDAMMSLSNPITLNRIQSSKRLYPYLRSICVFKTMDRVRAAIHEKKFISDIPINEETINETSSIVFESPIHKKVDVKMMLEVVENIIQSLTVKEALCVKLCWKDGLGIQKASELAGVSRNTVTAVLKRTKTRVLEEIRKINEN